MGNYKPCNMDIAKNRLPENNKVSTEEGDQNSDYTSSISNLTFRKALKNLLEFQALKNRIFRIFDGGAIPRYSKPIEDEQIHKNQGDDINQNGSFGIGINKGNASANSIAGTINENGNNYIKAERVNIYEQSKSKEKVDRLVITLNGVDFNKFTHDKEIQEAVSLLLQKASGDTSVNFEKIEEGSIKITLNGSSEGLKRLAALIESEELGELKEDLEKLGLSIENAKLLTKDIKDESASAKEDEIRNLLNQITKANQKVAIKKTRANRKLPEPKVATLIFISALSNYANNLLLSILFIVFVFVIISCLIISLFVNPRPIPTVITLLTVSYLFTVYIVLVIFQRVTKDTTVTRRKETWRS